MGAPKLASKSDLSVAAKIDLFKACPLFEDADPPAFEFLATHAVAVTVPKGEPIILENEANDHVYFVAQGAIEIVTYISDEKRIQRIALLKPGTHFAELSVLAHTSKSGSAYAYETSQLLRLPGAKFVELLHLHPGIAARLALKIANLNEIVESAHEFVPFYQPSQLLVQPGLSEKMPASMWKTYGAIPFSLRAGVLSIGLTDPANTELFQFLDQAFNRPVVNAFLMTPEELEEGITIAKANSNAPSRPRAPLALVKQPLPLDPLEFLKVFPLTSNIAEESLVQMIPHLGVREFKEGEIIAEPGSHESMQVLVSGRVEVSRAIPQSRGRALVMTLEAGDMIGTASLLAGKPTQHTYRALEAGKIVTITDVLVEHLMASPAFTIPLTVALAGRLSKLNGLAGIKYVKSLDGFNAKEMADLIPLSFATEQKVVPLKLDQGEVWLGLAGSSSKRVTPHLTRYLSDYRLRFFGLSEAHFQAFLRQLKAASDEASAARTSAAVHRPAPTPVKSDPVALLNEILSYGMKNRASDIHFEPSEEFMTVRFRIDGVLNERPEKLPINVGKEMVSRIKVLSSMDVGNNKATQDGQLKTTINDHQLLARASVLPIKHGEKVVLRLLKSHGSVVPLTMLVPDRRAIKILQEVSKTPQGLFLVTGPTGSGKTTTLYSLLSEINRVDVNVVTIEEPVELEIPGCNQCEVDRKRGIEFANVLRSVLRQDPDVIMVGEIRDEESAKIVFEAAITGHMVLSTLHTTRSTDVGPRLRELGVDGATISAGLIGVLAQRLVRAICKKCVSTRPMTIDESDFALNVLGPRDLPHEVRFGQGCPACANTGYHDRLVVLEVWRNTLAMRKALTENAGPEELMRIAREDGFETILEVGVRLALAGLTTIEEVRRSLGSG